MPERLRCVSSASPPPPPSFRTQISLRACSRPAFHDRAPAVNSLEDFCLFAPPNPGAGSVIGNTERIEVAWCVQGGHGTRVMPAGTVKGAHFVQTPDYVQVTGVGDFTKINIPAGDEGGELDPHGADGNGALPSEVFGGKRRELMGMGR